jgi:hypothetical protein
MQAVAVVLQVALGPNHELYLNYKRQSVDDFDRIQPTLESKFQKQQNPLMFAEMLRWIQLRFHHYWDGLSMNVGYVSPTVFHELYTDIRYKTWKCPSLPAAYLQAQKRVKDGEAKGDGGKKRLPMPSQSLTPTRRPTCWLWEPRWESFASFLRKLPQMSQNHRTPKEWKSASPGT